MATTPNLGLETIEPNDKANSSMLEKMNDNFSKIDTAYKELGDNLMAKTGKETIAEAIESIDDIVVTEDGTITADKVFNGYVGYAKNERIVGTALATETNGEASNLLTGRTLYDNNGNLVTGTMQNYAAFSVAAGGSLSENLYKLRIPTNAYYSTSSSLYRSKANVISDLGIKVVPTIVVGKAGTNSTHTGYVANWGAGINDSGTLVIWAESNSTSYEHICFRDTSINQGTVQKGWNKTSFDTGDPAYVPYACTVSGLGSYSTIKVDLNVAGVNSSYDYIEIQVTLEAW